MAQTPTQDMVVILKLKHACRDFGTKKLILDFVNLPHCGMPSNSSRRAHQAPEKIDPETPGRV